jgi:hypothetical protein
MMTTEELKTWADAEAEDCLRYGTEPTERLKRNIADHLQDAYRTGVQHEKIRRDKQQDARSYVPLILGKQI